MVNSDGGGAAAATGFDPKAFIFRSPRGELTIPPDLTIPSFLFQTTSARAYHHRVAIADASSRLSLTFSQLRLRIGSAARALSYVGVSQGDVVLLLSPNSIHFPVLFFAIVSLGAVATTANPVYTPREIERQARDSRAKLILVHPDLLPKLSSGLNLPILVIDSDSGTGKRSSSHCPAVSYLSDAERLSAGHLPPPARIRQADTAVLLYSSGTTSASKAVALSHLNLIASAIQTNSDADRLSETDLSFFVAIPFFHAYGLSVILFAQLQRGNTIVTTPRFDLVDMLKAIEEYHVTSLPLVPPIMLALAKHDVALKYDLSSVTEITSAAAPLGKETIEEVASRFKIPNVRQGYGMTETAGFISVFPLRAEAKNFATVGPLVAGMEAVVVDPTSGERLPPNKQGELWVRGPNVMQGYLNNPEATAATLEKDGWLHTGDLVYIDDDGYIYIMDRLKELIKYKALQVAPAELEALLLTHPEIEDVAVVPLPDEDAGEVPFAYVVRAKGSSLQERDVIEFVAPQVAPYKKVRKVCFIDAIPRSSSGKILRRSLNKALSHAPS